MSYGCIIVFSVILWWHCSYCSFPFHPGPRYHDKPKESHGPCSYAGPPCEPTRMPHQGWAYPPRGMNHRSSLPIRPPFGGPVPVGIRGMY